MGGHFGQGLGVMLDFSTHDGMERHHQISQIAGKVLWMEHREWLLAYHITDSDQILDDFLDRFETAFLWSFVIPVNRLEISPYMRLAYAHYKQPKS